MFLMYMDNKHAYYINNAPVCITESYKLTGMRSTLGIQ
jgi:hypothetical protein